MDYKVWAECPFLLSQKLIKNNVNEYVPVSELSSYMDEDMLKNVDIQDNELYYYIRTVNKLTSDEIKVEKVIIKIQDTTVLDNYIQEKNDAIQDMFNRVHSPEIESLKNNKVNYELFPEYIHPDMVLLEQYEPLVINKRYMLTKKEMDILIDALMNVLKEMEPLEQRLTENEMRTIYKILFSYGFYINKCSILKLYMFGEHLEKEKKRFPTHEIIPSFFFYGF